ncbi:hypothetical protein ACFO25_09875 [Paenactinomyces guangxiensis]|uniref:Uncharacterized protein n=1 Tax=Paenactinomyces guangxiensis TaxID=1490290 RepID=A0A7W2A9E4_9BACL|nr:hypothetical protein [Paenactinomyces guangxiensis]MBA4495092.1 hypothetical protein [Paenactinomyces guangxiensis]MBH8592224.1 hypothetical protein [Paenactinomyces guangxiensis]
MTTTYFPFDSGAGANVKEEQWSQMARYWRNDGILPDNPGGAFTAPNDIQNKLQVVGDDSTLSVIVFTGSAWIQGHFFDTDSNIDKTLSSVTTSGNSRIDMVVLRLDWLENTISVEVIEGTEATNPTAPSLTKNFGSRWEIPLAQVAVPYGATTGLDCTIVDKRKPALSVDMVPVCEIGMAADQTVTSSTNYQKLNLDTVRYDNFDMADVDNKRVSIRMNGLYLVKLNTRMSSASVINTITLNDSPATSNFVARSEGVKESSLTWIGNLNDGQTIGAWVYNNSGSNVTWNVTNVYTPSLTVVRMGDKATS